MGCALVGIDHVQLAIPPGGEDAARAFYCGVLGLFEVAKPEALAVRGGCWFQSDLVTVHVGVDPAFAPATKAHPAFIVDSVDAFAEHVRTLGVDFCDDTELAPRRRGYVADPFGNRIEITERTADPKGLP